jgi:GABA(A) receptor-associated protein
MTKSFKERFELTKRKLEAKRVREKYPDRIPIIVETANTTNLILDKNKYLCPGDVTCGQFIYVIRKKTKLKPEHAMFVFINGTMPAAASLMSQIYKEHADKDGFLYLVISQESTFGMT